MNEEVESTYVSETVLNVFLAPWNQPSGANWFDAYHQPPVLIYKARRKWKRMGERLT